MLLFSFNLSPFYEPDIKATPNNAKFFHSFILVLAFITIIIAIVPKKWEANCPHPSLD